MRSWVGLFALLLVIWLWPAPVRAQDDLTIGNLAVEYVFGESIIFRAQLNPPQPVEEAYLLFVVQGEPNTRLIPLRPTADGRLEYRHLVQGSPVRPFARVEYWFQVRQNGHWFSSKRAVFRYVDNRYPWQTLQQPRLAVHWYAGDLSFGQAALDVAQAGLTRAENYLGFSAQSPLEIYIYATATDLQDALQLGQVSWVAGHASPDLGVALVSIEPGENERLEMERQIPHELAHLLLYQMVGQNYQRLPTWLVEGIASQMEGTLNQDYIQVLAYAQNNRTLLPISGLCGPFPADVSGALLAYAEADSFVRYLQTMFGTSGLQRLIYAYADGLNCEQGARNALGLSLTQLDQHWQKAMLGEQVAPLALQNLLPYFALLLILLLSPFLPFLVKTNLWRGEDELSRGARF